MSVTHLSIHTIIAKHSDLACVVFAGPTYKNSLDVRVAPSLSTTTVPCSTLTTSTTVQQSPPMPPHSGTSALATPNSHFSANTHRSNSESPQISLTQQIHAPRVAHSRHTTSRCPKPATAPFSQGSAGSLTPKELSTASPFVAPSTTPCPWTPPRVSRSLSSFPPRIQTSRRHILPKSSRGLSAKSAAQ